MVLPKEHSLGLICFVNLFLAVAKCFEMKKKSRDWSNPDLIFYLKNAVLKPN